MPKAPITARTLYWERLSDGTLHPIDWSLVTTSLGVMVEPKSLLRMPAAEGIRDEDLFDSSFTTIAVVPALPTGNYAFDQVAFQGVQWPRYRSTDPGAK